MGAGGYVRGKTRDEAWENFVDERDKAEAQNLVVDYPKNKADAFAQLGVDPATGEWVLEYHFSD